MAIASHDVQFDKFMAAIDARLHREIGVGYRDLPDFAYALAYEDGMHPSEVVEELIAGLDELG
jgi:hypothetical protein